MQLFRIVGWSDHYENNRTREVKNMNWVPIANKLDGDGYTELIDTDGSLDGAAIYGAWIACVLVASRCDPRGTLLRSQNRPHTSRTLARITRLPAAAFDAMFEAAQRVGWIEVCDDLAASCDDDAAGCALPNPITNPITNPENLSASLAESRFEKFWVRVHRKTGKQAARRAFDRAVNRVRLDQSLTIDGAATFICERMVAFAASPAAHPTDITPIHPSTWLNAGRYDDDPTTWQGNDRQQRQQEVF